MCWFNINIFEVITGPCLLLTGEVSLKYHTAGTFVWYPAWSHSGKKSTSFYIELPFICQALDKRAFTSINDLISLVWLDQESKLEPPKQGANNLTWGYRSTKFNTLTYNFKVNCSYSEYLPLYWCCLSWWWHHTWFGSSIVGPVDIVTHLNGSDSSSTFGNSWWVVVIFKCMLILFLSK